MSDSEPMSSNEDQTEQRLTKEEGSRRPKRNKKKKEKAEDNAALDPVRYKTKMCKNWQLHEKCPYGPRCLFAHGVKEMRTFSHNSHAITNACNSEAPDRDFYALGHFPLFMPHPFPAEEEQNEPAGQTVVAQEQPADESHEEVLVPLAQLAAQIAAAQRAVNAPKNTPELPPAAVQRPRPEVAPSPASQCFQYPYFSSPEKQAPGLKPVDIWSTRSLLPGAMCWLPQEVTTRE